MQTKVRCVRERSFLANSRSRQGGMNAAILVAIIAGLIILYIVFLPTAEREKIVEKRATDTTAGDASNVLLKAFPGILSTSEDLEDEKEIPNIFLVETTNAKEMEKINPFIVRSGWFDKKAKKIDFGLEDPDNTDNVVVSFTAKKRQGILTIKLNDAVVFENELASDTIEPVKLDKKSLGKTNSLEFSVSSVGLKFWTTNEYSMENVKIIGDITDTSKQESANIFALSDSEFSSMDKATLKFIPYCGDVNELGTLDIYINNKKLFSSVPVCDNAYKQSIPKTMLNEAENNIVFKTNRGSYSVEQIKIALDFKDPIVKTYSFKLDEDTFNKIIDGDQDVTLTIKFVDDKKQKMAKLDVNGKTETIDTEKASFSRIINNKVSEGNNFVRLEPLEDLEVAELRVELT
ncbi:hypothetical protein HYX04_03555 [Candidatus Woesearchaeota archaeon]|nr:hypothetical protein [Candidatus Woesearchaeota archaeon]